MDCRLSCQWLLRKTSIIENEVYYASSVSPRRNEDPDGSGPAPGPGVERKTSPAGSARLRRTGRLNPGSFWADVASFGLHLAAENKAAATIRTYTEAPRWFASAYLLAETDKTRWQRQSRVLLKVGAVEP